MQIAQYINYISIASPRMFDTIYAKADLMSNVNLNFTFIQNPFVKFAACSSLPTDTLSQISDPSFMYNTGNQIFVWALLAGFYGLSIFALKYLPIKCIKIRVFFKEMHDSYYYTLPIETFNEIFMTVIFYSFLNLFHVQ